MSWGPLFFAAPWALAVLAALPLLWLVLRAAPPIAQKITFPPLRLLLGLKTADETTGRPPWWLLLLRALAAALLIIGFARPSLTPDGAGAAPLPGPILIAVDDGWPAAARFDDVRSVAGALIARAERAGQSVTLLFTAPLTPPESGPLSARAAAEARAVLLRLDPKPWRPDRVSASTRLAATEGGFAEVHWLSDGVGSAGDAAFSEALKAKGPLTVRRPLQPALAVIDARATPKGVEVVVRRSSPLGVDGAIAADTLDGRPLGVAEYSFPVGAKDVVALIPLPAEIAARAARVRIVGERSAGAVRLLPAAAGRPIVGLIDPGAQGQPLLSDLHYVERAIEPYAQLRRGQVERLIADGAQALVLPDASRLSPPDQRALSRWLEEGGLLIRFAGPRLANDSDAFVPAPVRKGARQLGGALAWETAQPLAPFDAESPFFGLEAGPEVTINRHVMIMPESQAANIQNQGVRVWARLADGAPVISAKPRGKGLIVLFHVSAGPDWSSLPLSGLYVDMLRRTVALAGRAGGANLTVGTASGPFVSRRLIDGGGDWAPAGPDSFAIPAGRFDLTVAGPSAPPGLYERAALTSALPALRPEEPFIPLREVAGAAMAGFGVDPPQPLAGLFLGLGGVLIALDLLVALALAGRLPSALAAAARLRGLGSRAGPGVSLALVATLLGLGALAATTGPAHAQRAGAGAAAPIETTDIQLAYVRTGDPRTDALAKQGLDALALTLRGRTAVEPGPSVGVDLARDDLSLYPLLYWLAPPNPQPLSEAALGKLDRYMRLGGMVFLDTRDAGSNANPGPAQILLRGLDAPPLEQVGADHVLTKSFYLMPSFPGRSDTTRIFAETANSAASRDGVPALLIGNGDWASLWAQRQADDAIALYDPDARRRELALRFGVNLVMVALTGNYKADQVHVPALLERMGAEGGRR
jgi:hypothetical protein